MKHADGLSALNALLDAADATPDRVRAPLAAIDHAAMTAAEREQAYGLFDRASAVGAIDIVYEKAGLGNKRPVKIKLLDGNKLAQFLGRKRSAVAATGSIAAVRAGIQNLPVEIEAGLHGMEAAWSRAKPWRRIAPGDVEGAVETLRLATTILARNAADPIDERTFSTRTVNDSKALSRRRDAILSILIAGGMAPDDATLEHFGIIAFPDHVQVRGPLSLVTPTETVSLEIFDPSAAVPPEQVNLIRLDRPPPYLITIENKTTFQRYVRQVRDGSLVVYTAGFVSAPCATLLRRILRPEMRWFHWGDIDGGGLAIFHWLETNIAGAKRIEPHLMSAELAKAHGLDAQENDPRLAKIAQSTSAVANLARWLLTDSAARILEQEMLDPIPPQLA